MISRGEAGAEAIGFALTSTAQWGPTHLADGTPYGKLHESACKEQFSLAYSHAVASAARCTLHGITPDVERVDYTVRQVADHTAYESAQIDVQMKCTSQSVMHDDGVHWKLETDHYEHLRSDKVYNPKILVVLVVPKSFGDWFDHSEERLLLRRSAYWVSLRGMPALPTGQDSKTVVLPKRQVFDVPNLLAILKRVGDGGTP